LTFYYVPYIWPFIASAVVTLALAIYAFMHKNIRGAFPFGLTMLVTAFWAGGYALETAGADLSTKLFWASAQSIGYTLAPVLWLIMVFRFIERDNWVTRRNTLLLLVLPFLAIILTFTNSLHGLMWHDAHLDTGNITYIAQKVFGAGFWIIAAYSYLLNIVSELLLIISLRRKAALYREQSLGLLIGLALLFIPNIVFITGLLTRYDLTSAIAGVSGIILAWSIFRFRLFDIVPVAMENIIEHMTDGLVVLDARDRIADINPAAKKIFRDISSRAAGQAADIFFKDFPVIADICRNRTDLPGEMRIETDGVTKTYELACLSLSDKRGKHTGFSITFHDVTEQRMTQSRLLEQERALAVSGERERLARDLHDNLGQVFSFINVQAQAIEHELSVAGVTTVSRKITRLIEAAQSAHREMREYIRSVKNNGPVDRDFVLTLETEAELLKKQTGLEIHLDIPAKLQLKGLKPDTRTQMLNIIKEALNNVRKHAKAENVFIKIRASDGEITAAVIDDGIGFDMAILEKQASHGLGLKIMKERAGEMGGEITINSETGKGTKVIIKISDPAVRS
jgi:PAS domain S-box-containing protein